MPPTPLTQMPKPQADRYAGKRKLLLAPLPPLPPQPPDDAARLLTRYWSEARDHAQSLERSLGRIAHVYHEAVFADCEEGMRMVEAMNPLGCSFARALRGSGAALHAVEDYELVQEYTDWQRCLSIGLMSEKVTALAMDGLRETERLRFERIGARVAETLPDGETGILFISESHGVQFAPDIQVFYIAPPALDALKRWLDNQMRAQAQAYYADAQPPAPQDGAGQGGNDDDNGGGATP